MQMNKLSSINKCNGIIKKNSSNNNNSSSSSSSSNRVEKKAFKAICKFHITVGCTKGVACGFMHPEVTDHNNVDGAIANINGRNTTNVTNVTNPTNNISVTNNNAVCTFWLKNGCKNEKNCRFLHEIPEGFVVPERETDAVRLAWRQKQIDIGKKSFGYQHYISVVSNEDRNDPLIHPSTPDKFKRMSKRAFQGKLKEWRRALRVNYDPAAPNDDEDEDDEDDDDNDDDNDDDDREEEFKDAFISGLPRSHMNNNNNSLFERQVNQ